MRFSRDRDGVWWAVFLSCLLVVVCVARLPSQSIRAISFVLTANGVYLAFAVFLFFRVNKWLGLWVALVIVSAQLPFYAVNVDGTLNVRFTGLMRQSSLNARDAIIVMSLWYALIVTLIPKSTVDIILDAVCVVALINAFIVICQHCSFDVVGWLTGDRWRLHSLKAAGAAGLMGNSNTTSGLLAMCFLPFMRNRWRLKIHRTLFRVPVLPVLSVSVLIAMAWTYSSNGAMALAAAVVFILPFVFFKTENDRHLALAQTIISLILIIMACFFFWLLIDRPGISGRIDIWKLGWAQFANRPLRGMGIGHWNYLTQQLHAHNDIWQMTFDMGILAPMLIAGYIVSALRRTRWDNLILQGCLVVITVDAFIAFPMHIATTAIVAVTLMALLNIEVKTKLCRGRNEDLRCGSCG